MSLKPVFAEFPLLRAVFVINSELPDYTMKTLSSLLNAALKEATKEEVSLETTLAEAIECITKYENERWLQNLLDNKLMSFLKLGRSFAIPVEDTVLYFLYGLSSDELKRISVFYMVPELLEYLTVIRCEPKFLNAVFHPAFNRLHKMYENSQYFMEVPVASVEKVRQFELLASFLRVDDRE